MLPKAYNYYFDLKFCHLRDRHRNEVVMYFKSKRKAAKIAEFHNFFVGLVEKINAEHGADISFSPCGTDDFTDSSNYSAILDFKDEPMEILVDIVWVLNENTKGIKSVKLFNYQKLFESEIDRDLLSELMNK